MDTFMRNLGLVQHRAALSILESRTDVNERGRCRAGPQADSCEEGVACPQPRRSALSCCATEFIKPACSWINSSRLFDCDAGFEILEVFFNKGERAEGDYSSFGCSPPVRTGNPIVQDKQFYNRPCSSPVNYVKYRAGAPSFSASPSVRIEGFECLERGLP